MEVQTLLCSERQAVTLVRPRAARRQKRSMSARCAGPPARGRVRDHGMQRPFLHPAGPLASRFAGLAKGDRDRLRRYRATASRGDRACGDVRCLDFAPCRYPRTSALPDGSAARRPRRRPPSAASTFSLRAADASVLRQAFTRDGRSHHESRFAEDRAPRTGVGCPSVPLDRAYATTWCARVRIGAILMTEPTSISTTADGVAARGDVEGRLLLSPKASVLASANGRPLSRLKPRPRRGFGLAAEAVERSSAPALPALFVRFRSAPAPVPGAAASLPSALGRSDARGAPRARRAAFRRCSAARRPRLAGGRRPRGSRSAAGFARRELGFRFASPPRPPRPALPALGPFGIGCRPLWFSIDPHPAPTRLMRCRAAGRPVRPMRWM